MNKLIMWVAALVLITAPARAGMDAIVLAEADRQAKKYWSDRAPKPQIIKVYIYTVPAKAAPAAPVVQPKPQPAPQFKPAPRTQAVKLEAR